jgi:hypothetical protein
MDGRTARAAATGLWAAERRGGAAPCAPWPGHAKRAELHDLPGFCGPVASAAGMRLILRIIGTVLIAFAVILLIIDGTKSLGANGLVFTSLGDAWLAMHAQSLDAVKQFLTGRLFGPILEPVVLAVLSFPGWAVIGIPGLLLAWAGRSRRVRMFIRQDQI